uniref:RWP-RK domain-containing protein n=1 Tax=Globisporangium ultimum (strain ATCC 200006 / CBS 805.95 / DAOM BR144) TaxID=431595 RepID=K3WJ34_GLOUD
MPFERMSYQQQPARFDFALSYHPRRVLQQMQPHPHVANPPMRGSQWTPSRPAAVERMALPALNIPNARAAAVTTASPSLPLTTMQRMTIQSPSISDITARNNAVAPIQSPANKKRVRALPNASKSITLDLLRPHFEKPLAEVAAMFGICMTLMKKICRKNGVPRWPHRQIRGLRKSIWSIEKALRCCESETQKRSYNDHLQKQRTKLLTILKGPDGPSRAAFDKILSEPCSPSFEFAASPASSSGKKKDLSVPFSLSSPERLPSYDQFRSSPVSHDNYTPVVVKLPPIASLLHKKIPLQRTTGTFSGSFHF